MRARSRLVETTLFAALSLGLAACPSKPKPPPAPALVAKAPAALFHAAQPMVVDVTLGLAKKGKLHVELPGDPGARPGEDAGPGTELSVRLRGLRPGTDYVAKLTVTTEDGARETRELAFKTLPPLPGMIRSFEVKQNGAPSSEFRIFDLSVNPHWTLGALYAVDPEGTTRFFLPRSAKAQTLSGLPAGLKLRPDGTLLFVQDDHAVIVDELGEVKLDIPAEKLGLKYLHHDIVELPNGNFISMSFAFADHVYAFDKKRHHIAGDTLVEFTRDGRVVWQWSSLDHLDWKRVRDGFPSPLPIPDPATGEIADDWTHGNTIVYLPEDDSVLFSMRHQDWIIKIDRKTGKVVWKLGEDGDFALDGDRWFYHQHSPEVMPDGSLLIYDNGVVNPHLPAKEQRSRPLVMKLDEQAKTAKIVWQETNEHYVGILAGDADRLDNGNILVLDSAIPLVPGTFQPSFGRLREVDPKGNRWVWSMDLPNGRVAYRCIHSPRLPGERAR